MPEGSYSWGVWGGGVFDDLAVGAYRMHYPDGRLRGYRFDAPGGMAGAFLGDLFHVLVCYSVLDVLFGGRGMVGYKDLPEDRGPGSRISCM